MLVLRGNAAFGLIYGQLFQISPTDLVEKPVFATMDQSDGAFSPDGSHLAWIQSNQMLWVGDADGQNAVKLDDVSQDSTFTAMSTPRWSPDGKHLTYQVFSVGQADQRIWGSNLTGSPTNLTSNAQADTAEWSPSGAKLAFESTRTGNVDIFTMTPDGSNQTNLTQATRDQSLPRWSPDGNSIAFYGPGSAGNTQMQIFSMNSDGSGQHGITSALTTTSDANPHWISNQQLVYEHSESGVTQLFVTSSQGTNQHVFSPSASSQISSMPSPDGKFIAWSEYDGGQNTQIWLSKVDVVSATRVTNSVGENNVVLGWKPCP